MYYKSPYSSGRRRYLALWTASPPSPGFHSRLGDRVALCCCNHRREDGARLSNVTCGRQHVDHFADRCPRHFHWVHHGPCSQVWLGHGAHGVNIVQFGTPLERDRGQEAPSRRCQDPGPVEARQPCHCGGEVEEANCRRVHRASPRRRNTPHHRVRRP